MENFTTSVYLREQGRDKATPRDPLFPGNHLSDNQCVVSGIDCFVLRVSSFFGMAPLRFKPSAKGYVVSISNYMCIYSYLLVTIVSAIAFFGAALEMKKKIDPSQHIFTYLSQVVSLCDIILVALMACAGVYGAPSRMRTMLQVMDTLAYVDKCVGTKFSRARLRKLWTALISFLFFFTVLIVYDIICYFGFTGDLSKKWDVLLHYSGFYFLWYLVIILEVQFAFTANSVQTRFQAVNEALSLTAKHISLQNMSGEPHFVVSPSDEVNRIASLHGALCDVVHNINKSYNFPLVDILLSTVFHLVISPYYMIMELNDAKSINNLHFIILEALWIILHVLRLLLMVEPCHFTAAEGKKTESLVCRMIQECPSSGPLPARLQLFSRQLMMQSPSYSPMGLCTLDRPLIASVFGAVTTYLVILIQFQKTDA